MKTCLLMPFAFAVLAAQVQAADFIDDATVISAVPSYAPNPPQRVCTDVQQAGNDMSAAGVVIGGVAGGLIGNTVGKGNGKTAATAVGAVAGALAGNAVANRANQPAQQKCQMVSDGSQHVTGYNVTYQYAGKTATVRMSRDPGRTLRVGVSVLPQ